MKRKLIFIYWALLVLLISQIFIALNKKQENADMITPEYIKQFDDHEIAKHVGLKINESDLIIDSQNDTLTLSELPTRDSLFIIRFSSFSCESCKEFAKNTALTYDLYTRYKMMVFIANIPVSDLHVLNRMNKNISFYKADQLSSDFDEGLTPYTMIIFNGIIQGFFIPHKEVPDNYQTYLKSLI